jgi:hypothetical protein
MTTYGAPFHNLHVIKDDRDRKTPSSSIGKERGDLIMD